MANKTDDNRRRLIALVNSRGWLRIGAEEWSLLRDAFPAFAESRLRKTLLEIGLKVDQPWRGVDLHSLEALGETLTQMAEFYTREPNVARRMVIASKDKARLAARNPRAAAEKRALKMEMVDWTLVWLGDPAMFAAWARLRRQQPNPAKLNRP